MQEVEKIFQQLKLDSLDRLPGLAFVEKKYKVKPSLIFVIVFVVLLVLAPILNTHSLLTSLVCYLIPAYLSFLALESTDKEDDIRYLTYWILFSLAEVGTPFLRFFLSKFLYMTFRIIVTIVLLHPLSDFSLKIYNNFVRPFLCKNEQRIDDGISNLVKEGKEKIINGVTEGIRNIA
jgi:receptor expression-enhancing protein 5/6